MSVFSIIQNSRQAHFNLQMKGRMPESAKPATTDPEDEKQAKANEQAKDRAIRLVEATTLQTGEEATEAEEMVEDYKEAVDLNSSLSRAVKDGADTEREMRIERMAQKIKSLKEALQFATPEKAKRMLRELQQISKDFRTASVELRKAAEKIGPDLPNTVVDVAADATIVALEKVTGSSEVSAGELVDLAEDFAEALQGALAPQPLPTGDSPAQLEASPASAERPAEASSGNTMTNRETETEAVLFAGDNSMQNDLFEQGGFANELQSMLKQKNDAAFLQGGCLCVCRPAASVGFVPSSEPYRGHARRA